MRAHGPFSVVFRVKGEQITQKWRLNPVCGGIFDRDVR